MQHNYLGTEHLLLGLIDDTAGISGRLLASLGVSRAKVWTEIDALVGRGRWTSGDNLPFTPRARHAIEQALQRASPSNSHDGSEQLLLALLAQPDSVAVKVLARLGVRPIEVATRLRSELGIDGRPASGDRSVGLVDDTGGPEPRCASCHEALAGYTVIRPVSAEFEHSGGLVTLGMVCCRHCGAAIGVAPAVLPGSS